MDMLYWLLIAAVFIIAFIGLVYPVIPSVVFIVAGFVLYGFLFSFSPYSYMFWLVEAVPQYYSQQITCRICLE